MSEKKRCLSDKALELSRDSMWLIFDLLNSIRGLNHVYDQITDKVIVEIKTLPEWEQEYVMKSIKDHIRHKGGEAGRKDANKFAAKLHK